MARAIDADMLLLVGKAGSGSDPVATLRGVTRSSSSVLRCSVCSADQSDTGDSSDACSILIVANFDDVLPAVMRPPAITGSPIAFVAFAQDALAMGVIAQASESGSARASCLSHPNRLSTMCVAARQPFS